MTVGKAGFNDIDTLVSLRLAYLCEDNGVIADYDLAAIQKGLPGYFRSHLNRDLIVYVIRDRDTIVSCAFLLIIEKPMSPAFITGRTGTVMNVYTRPSDRRKGCAGMIMKTLIREAKGMELSVLELKSTEDGYPVYRSAGFSEEHSRYRMMKWQNPETGPDRGAGAEETGQ